MANTYFNPKKFSDDVQDSFRYEYTRRVGIEYLSGHLTGLAGRIEDIMAEYDCATLSILVLLKFTSGDELHLTVPDEAVERNKLHAVEVTSTLTHAIAETLKQAESIPDIDAPVWNITLRPNGDYYLGYIKPMYDTPDGVDKPIPGLKYLPERMKEAVAVLMMARNKDTPYVDVAIEGVGTWMPFMNNFSLDKAYVDRGNK